ncbi:MAG: inorganic diphosphatase [Promethearchaeota archaeon]
MLYWKNIIPGKNPPYEIYALIECPKGTKNKYEISKTTNILILDRVLHSSVIYPQDYGFIPGTLASDGDPLDILVLTAHSSDPKTLITAKPIGVLIMQDEKGVDEKILAISLYDPHYNIYEDIVQLPRHYLDEIHEFFRTYKALEESSYAEVKEWRGRDAAFLIIEESIKRFKEKYGNVATIDPRG